MTIIPDVRGRLNARNATLVALIGAAWGLPPSRIVGATGWMASERYDVEAKPPAREGYYAYEEIEKMMQALLADRFSLVAHLESRELHAYALRVAKGGPKLTKANPQNCFMGTLTSKPEDVHGLPLCGFAGQNGHMRGYSVDMSQMAGQLEQLLAVPVQNETGLSGEYDIDLQFAPPAAAAGTSPPDSVDQAGPSIFTALAEQLGIRLDSVRAPIEVLVVDRAGRPSPN
jgi:uncharacterized protein (TIGR03435 family)